MKTLDVAVVDDHSLFRKGVIQLLQLDPAITVVAEGECSADAIAIAEEYAPSVMLMDVEMPGNGPEKCLSGVLAASPNTSVLILTMHDDVAYVRSLVSCGAAGYMLKTIDHGELIAAVKSVSAGSSAVRVSVSRSTLAALTSTPEEKPAQAISARELEVLQLVAGAASNAEIAAKLYVSQGTVKRHLTNIYTKLGASSRIDALIKARAAGLIEPGPQ
ncbi:response regulator transcription factor [Nocardia sp. SSK8]|uniref:response regulator transcription factor n=1 Tax=Nocardia sp. SSK8 TaxID=3120154 RepID=UPI00300BC8B2